MLSFVTWAYLFFFISAHCFSNNAFLTPRMISRLRPSFSRTLVVLPASVKRITAQLVHNSSFCSVKEMKKKIAFTVMWAVCVWNTFSCGSFSLFLCQLQRHFLSVDPALHTAVWTSVWSVCVSGACSPWLRSCGSPLTSLIWEAFLLWPIRRSVPSRWRSPSVRVSMFEYNQCTHKSADIIHLLVDLNTMKHFYAIIIITGMIMLVIGCWSCQHRS